MQGAQETRWTALIEVPVELKRRGLAVRLIVLPPGGIAALEPDPKLIAAVAKAHEWFARLRSGRCESVTVLAQEQKVDQSYARRVVCLAFLDPENVKRILRGRSSREPARDGRPENLTIAQSPRSTGPR